jgi:ferredoxin
MSSKPLLITVDRTLCAACDLCRENAPNTFELDAEAKANVKNPTGDPREIIIEASASCPMDAITVRDPDTGEQLVPRPR